MSALQVNIHPVIYLGKWDDLHQFGLAAKSEEDCCSAASCMRIICYTHYCPDCRHHATKHLEDELPEASFNDLFEYTVNFHNNVNYRLGKKVIHYNQALEWYTGNNGTHPPHYNSPNIYIGKWNDIHTIAVYADLSGGDMNRDYEWALYVICGTLPNQQYINNCTQWLQANPPRRYFDNRCFYHSWMFHNYINQLANRPINRRVSYEQAHNWYMVPRTQGCIPVPDRNRPGVLIMSCQ